MAVSELDPRLASAFDELREQSGAPADHAAMEAARAAMHRAVAAQPQRRGLGLLAFHLRLALTPARLLAAGGGAVAGLAVVATLGWNAPAGSALHAVRVAHEALVLALPGADRVGLDLDYAEARLHDAQHQSGSWSSSLDEAGRFLDDARRHLTSTSPQWSRWQGDEKLLSELRTSDDHGGTTGGSEEGSGGSASPQPGGGTSNGESSSSDEHEGTTSTSTSTHEGSQSSSSSSTTEHSSSSTTTESTSSSSSDGGGGSSSSTSSSSSSDGGGGSSSGSDG
jgi:hypothetical protein